MKNKDNDIKQPIMDTKGNKNERMIYKATIEKEIEGKRIISEKHTIARKIKEDPWVKLYMRHITAVTSASSGAQTVLLSILQRMDPENIIRITGYDKQLIADKYGVTIKHIERLLRELCDRCILKALARSVYFANPNIVGYGDWLTILEKRDHFRLTIDYDRTNQTYSLEGKVVETDGKKYKTTRKSLVKIDDKGMEGLALELPFDSDLEFREPDKPLKLTEQHKGGKK